MKRRVSRWIFALLAAASCALVFAPPFDELCDRSFAWHMVQHLVIMFVVPLCVLLADPFHAVLAVAGKRKTAALLRVTAPLRGLASPFVALPFFIGVLWGAHFSPLYEASLEREWIHVAEHALFFFAGTVFWLPVLAPAPVHPVSFPARMFYLLLALPQGALLGAAIGGASKPLYPFYAMHTSTAAALADQSNAAAVMWICGGLVIFTAFLSTAGFWAARERRALSRPIRGEAA